MYTTFIKSAVIYTVYGYISVQHHSILNETSFSKFEQELKKKDEKSLPTTRDTIFFYCKNNTIRRHLYLFSTIFYLFPNVQQTPHILVL